MLLSGEKDLTSLFFMSLFSPTKLDNNNKTSLKLGTKHLDNKKKSHRIPSNFQASYPEKLTRSRCSTGSASTGVASVLTSPTASAPTSPGRSPCSSIALPKSLFRSCYEPNNQTITKKHLTFFWHLFLARQFLSKHPDILGFI